MVTTPPEEGIFFFDQVSGLWPFAGSDGMTYGLRGVALFGKPANGTQVQDRDRLALHLLQS